MRRILYFLVVCCLLGGCAFEWSSGDLVFQSADGWEDVADIEPEDVGEDVDLDAGTDESLFDVMDIDNQVDLPDIQPDEVEEIDIPDVKPDETVVNPCDEDEYPDPILKKCLKYPCCDLNGAWIFEMTDNSVEPWQLYVYTVVLEQEKAYLEFEIVAAASPDSRLLPEFLTGTLEKSLLHLQGGNMAEEGFLALDAKKVEQALFEIGEIGGTYSLIIAGSPTISGPWTLIPNF